ncbi:MAG: hypothetical protein PHS04_11190 [Tissierellia bacterium]|nr:hypothetical protein [Tissierellia bacterium]
MKTQNTKSRKMLVKLIDEQGHIFSKIFNIELPNDFNQSNFNVDRIEIAQEFYKPYPKALSELASALVSTQVSELDKIRILADSTLDAEIKTRFVSDYNAATAKRIHAFNNLHPKAKAYRAEKGLQDVTLQKFHSDFSPLDPKTKQKYNTFRYVTLSEDQKSYKLNAVKIADQTTEAIDK